MGHLFKFAKIITYSVTILFLGGLTACSGDSAEKSSAENAVASQEKEVANEMKEATEQDLKAEEQVVEQVDELNERALEVPEATESGTEEHQPSVSSEPSTEESKLEPLKVRHNAIASQGPIFDVESIDELNLLMSNTKYLNITFYDNYCFANTQQSYNMVHNQPELLKQIPDMIFANVHIEQFPDLAKQYQVSATPFTVLVDNGQAVVGSPGYYDTNGLVQLMEEHLSDL
jgi:hypothetical protein